MSLVVVTTIIDIYSSRSSSGRCSEVLAAHGILSLVCCVFLLFSLVHVCDDDLYCFS